MPGAALILDAPVIPGWYGKIPALGDFASRRLPRAFIEVWDHWLSHAIAASRAQLEEEWLPHYLQSPIWRFALLPGVCGQRLWAGVLMPSVDKVGRYFPLTMAVELPPDGTHLGAVLGAAEWYAALERVALSTLATDGTLDRFEIELAKSPFLPSVNAHGVVARELAGWWCGAGAPIAKILPLPVLEDVNDLFIVAAQESLVMTGVGKSIWWSAHQSRFHCFSGLPPEHHFASLLDNGI